MDASVFAKMLSDPGMLDLKKMGYKYGQGDLQEFLTLLKRDFYQELLGCTVCCRRGFVR